LGACNGNCCLMKRNAALVCGSPFLGVAILALQCMMLDADKYVVATFPQLRAINYIKLPDTTWRPLVLSGIAQPTAVCLDAANYRLFVADNPAGLVLWYQLQVLANGMLITDGRQHVAARSISTRSLSVNSVGSLYIAGQKLALPPFTSEEGLFVQDAIALATTATSDVVPDPLVIWTRTNTGGGQNPKLWMPSAVFVDPFHIYWGNSNKGKDSGAVLKAGLTAPQLDSAKTVLKMADNVDNVRSIIVTANYIFYAAPGGIYGMYKTKTTSGCSTGSTGKGSQFGQCAQVLALQDPQGMVWDGDSTLYVADQNSGAIYSIPSTSIKGLGSEKVVAAPNIDAMAVLIFDSGSHMRGLGLLPMIAALLIGALNSLAPQFP